MTENKMRFLEGLLQFIRSESQSKPREVIGITDDFFNGGLRILLGADTDLPEGDVSYTRVEREGDPLKWRKSVTVNGVEYCKFISNEQFMQEVA